MSRRATSAQQFEIMLAFMEQHGDLCKPAVNPRGRHVAAERWKQLTSLLNSTGHGEARTAEKWRKVWSDLKSNIRKKAQRAKKAAGGTGGGPADFESLLTDFDNRVLAIVSVVAVTGMMEVVEVMEVEEPERASVQLPADIELVEKPCHTETLDLQPRRLLEVSSPASASLVDVMPSTSSYEALDAVPSASPRVLESCINAPSPSPRVLDSCNNATPASTRVLSPRKRPRSPIKSQLHRRIRSSKESSFDKFEKSDSEWRKYRLMKLQFEEERIKREDARMKREDERLKREDERKEREYERREKERQLIQKREDERIKREDERMRERIRLEERWLRVAEVVTDICKKVADKFL